MNTVKDSIEERRNKFCIVGKKDGLAKRSSYVIGKRFAKSLENLCFKLDSEISNLVEELSEYKKCIFIHQKCDAYSFKFNIKDIFSLSHLVVTRESKYASLFNSASNGFSVYCSMKSHKNFIPFITDFPTNCREPKEITIGFYERLNVVPDALRYLQYEINNSKNPIRLVTFGENTTKFENVINHYHTYDNEDFFSRITHYYCPQSAVFMDPFPHALLEAIQLNKQIISPLLPNRKHRDGIDDLLQFIKYHHKLDDAFSDKWYNHSNHGLWMCNFKKFYSNVLENDFSNYLEYNKYQSFYDWCANEL